MSACSSCDDNTLAFGGEDSIMGRCLLEQERAPGQLVLVSSMEYAVAANAVPVELAAMGFDGYAVGGVSVGEPE